MEACLVTRAEDRAGERTEKRDTLIETAVCLLEYQFLASALVAPLSMVPTPAWGEKRKQARLIDVLSDNLAGKDSDRDWDELVRALSQSKAGQEFLKRQAKAYAQYHAEDEVLS